VSAAPLWHRAPLFDLEARHFECFTAHVVTATHRVLPPAHIHRKDADTIGADVPEKGGPMRPLLVSVMAVALGLVGAAPIEAQEGTRCRHEFKEFSITPGFSMTPSTGTHSGTATITCDGPVNGKQPTGPGTVTDEGPYGTKDPDSCTSASEGGGTDTIRIPTADGIVNIVSKFTYIVTGPSTQGGVLSVRFEGTRYSGNLEITPIDGDCFTAPITKVKGFGEGILHPLRKTS
jgi:hypothetical protein